MESRVRGLPIAYPNGACFLSCLTTFSHTHRLHAQGFGGRGPRRLARPFTTLVKHRTHPARPAIRPGQLIPRAINQSINLSIDRSIDGGHDHGSRRWRLRSPARNARDGAGLPCDAHTAARQVDRRAARGGDALREAAGAARTVPALHAAEPVGCGRAGWGGVSCVVAMPSSIALDRIHYTTHTVTSTQTSCTASTAPACSASTSWATGSSSRTR